MLRISLRELLTMIAAIALVIVSMRSGSPFWQGVIGLVVLFAMGAAVIAAVFEHGQRRVFAIGAAILMVGYAMLVVVSRDELHQPTTILPTSILLQSIYPIVEHGAYMDYAGNDVPPNVSLQTNPDGSNSYNGQPVYYDERPDSRGFMPIGHYWFLLLFGYVGGRFARFIYVRRNKETSPQSPPA